MRDLAQYIEHTLLRQDAKAEEIIKLTDEAKKYNFKGVCVNPCYIELAKEQLAGTKTLVVTVIGFPLGASTTASKVCEARDAVKRGADEIDMVINVCALKNQDYEYIKNDIMEVKEACGAKSLKVIIETDLLEKSEIKKACQLAAEAGADFVKTSTGFVKNGVGAKSEDVKLMMATVAPLGLQVKASGGIKNRAIAVEMINAGAERLGTSSGVEIVCPD